MRIKSWFPIVMVLAIVWSLGANLPVHAAPITIDFETPNLGVNSRQMINPYTDVGSGVKFMAEGGGFGDEVVGLVKNNATSACADPADTDQKLGTGRNNGAPGANIGLAGFAIRATFPTPLAPPVTVSAEFQTLAGQPIRIRLFDATNTEVGNATDTANPADGTCGFPGDPRARKSLSAASATHPVAYAILDMGTATGGFVFVIDNFKFEGGPDTNFPSGPADDVTQSLGSFRVLVAPAFRPLMAGYPGYDATTGRLQSPNLYDPHTVIGRSAVIGEGDATDAGGTPVGTAGTIVRDGSFGLVPVGFEGLADTHEVHTEVRSLNMTSWNCVHIPGVAVHAGINAPGRPISPGEVESLGGTDFPAKSFFNVFAEIDLPAMAGFPGGTLYNTAPLLVSNTDLTSFPPHVVYVHVNANAVPLVFRDTRPGRWKAGDLFGWLVLAGHATGFNCNDQAAFTEVVNRQPEMKPIPVEIDNFPFSLAEITLLKGDQQTETVRLHGPTVISVTIDPATGKTQETSRDGLDQVQTEMTQLELTGDSSFGPITVRLDKSRPTKGLIRETNNITKGVLDLPPFAPEGSADSFFDVFLEMEVNTPGAGARIFHTAGPIRMQTTITHKPPAPGETYQNPFTQRACGLAGRERQTGWHPVSARDPYAEPADRTRSFRQHRCVDHVGGAYRQFRSREPQRPHGGRCLL